MVQFYIYLLIFFVNGESEKKPVNNYKEAHLRVSIKIKITLLYILILKQVTLFLQMVRSLVEQSEKRKKNHSLIA